MVDDRQIRKLINSKQDVVEFSGIASKNSMEEGQTAIQKNNNGQLALYRKKFGKLWKSYMSYDGNQYVDRNMFVKNNIIYNGFLKNQHYPAFKSYISTSADEQAIANDTRVRVTFDAESYDVGGNYDTSAYKFTAPISGIYHFNVKVLWDNNATTDAGDWTAEDRHDLYLVKNDGNVNPSVGNIQAAELAVVSGTISDYYVMSSLSSDLKLDAGDYMEVAVWQNSGVTQNTFSNNAHYWSAWTGHLITAI
jgi:hypothetical protein